MLSAVLLVISIGSLAVQGLNFGIDFTGGTLLEVGYEQPADLPRCGETLSGGGFGDAAGAALRHRARRADSRAAPRRRRERQGRASRS